MGLLLLAMLVALVADRLWGEPPLRWHPVVWMGNALEAFAQRIAPLAPTGRDSRSFWLAALAWCALAAMVLVVAALLQALLLWVVVPAHQPASAAFLSVLGSLGLGSVKVLHATRWLLAALLLGLLLKPLLALALLQIEVRAVEAALAESLLSLRDTVPPAGWDQSGTSAGYAWQIRSGPYPTEVTNPRAPKLHEVMIMIAWGSEASPHQLDVVTLLPEQQPIDPAGPP